MPGNYRNGVIGRKKKMEKIKRGLRGGINCQSQSTTPMEATELNTFPECTRLIAAVSTLGDYHSSESMEKPFSRLCTRRSRILSEIRLLRRTQAEPGRLPRGFNISNTLVAIEASDSTNHSRSSSSPRVLIRAIMHVGWALEATLE